MQATTVSSQGLQGLDIALGSDDRPVEETLDLIAMAEDLRVANAWLTESRGRDVFVLLAAAARRTARIGLGTGITGVFSRTPTAIAQAAATLTDIMPGRALNLGLGASGKHLVEAYHGVPFIRPRARLRETVRVVDHILREGYVPDGGNASLRRRSRMTIAPARDRVKIFVAAGGAETLDFIGREADGWLPIWPSRRAVGTSVEALQAAASDAGRPAPVIAGYLYGAVGTEPGLDTAVRSTMAWYIGANGTAYRSLFDEYGYGSEVAEIVRLWSAGDHAGARRAVSEEMLQDCALIGTPTEFLDRMHAYGALGVRPILRIAREQSSKDVERMLRALSAETAGRPFSGTVSE